VIDCRERAVVELWRKGHLSLGTIVIYLQWVRRFRTYCDKRKLPETEQLTAVGARRFAKAYAGPRLKGRQSSKESRNLASNALHAWACASAALGTPLPPWRDNHPPTTPTVTGGVLPLSASPQWGLGTDAGARCRDRAWLPRATAQWKDHHCESEIDRCGCFCAEACHPSFETNRRGYLQFAPRVSPISAHNWKIDGSTWPTRWLHRDIG
jgi:hypothetical protein